MAKPITREGLLLLKNRLAELQAANIQNVEDIQVARSYGDLRENVEYHSLKEKQAQLEINIGKIHQALLDSEVVDYMGNKSGKVQFGATVKCKYEDDSVKRWQIVGADESSLGVNKISIESPIGKALLGKKVGDIIVVNTPKGEVEIEIISLEYI